MRKISKFCLTAIAAALVVPVQDASALTLGRVRGAALIGRPLSVTIPVTLEPGDTDPCVQAEVFQGDTRMDRSGARVERAADGSFQVRVTSGSPVEEPVITLFLRVGCSQPVTRRYVLLSEYQDDAQQQPAPAFRAPAAASVPAVPAPRAAEPPLVLRPAPAQRAPAPAPRASAAAPAPRAPAPVVAAAPPAPDRSPKRADPVPAPRGKPGREVLKIEPIDLSIDYAPALKGTTELQSTPSEGAKRAEAAAMWAALNLPPEELIRQTRRIEIMETEVKSLKEAVQRNSSVVNVLGQQLEKARAERNVVTMVLLALLALAGGAGAFLLWRRGREAVGGSGMRWWARQDPPDSAFEPVRPAAVVAKPPAPAPAAEGKPAEPRRRASASEEVVTPSSFSRLQREAIEPGGDPRHHFVQSSDFSASQPGSMRSVKAEELIDIQQQAEFFVSIGQHHQALALLESHVHDHVETSPVAWLDLLELYHALGERDNYERIRAEFQALFNAQVPDFENYRTQSGGLEEYRRALSRIVALWPSPRVLSLIEDSIFRKPGTPGAEPFDLAAYRDLLLLYNVAKDIVRDGASPARSAPMSMLNELDRESESGRMGFLDSRPFESLPRPNEDPWQLRTSPRIEAEAPPQEEGNLEMGVDIDIDLEALEPPGDELGPLVGAPDATGEPLSAEDRDSMISFDFELMPSQGKPPDVSRRG